MSQFNLHDMVQFSCCNEQYEGEIIAISKSERYPLYHIASDDPIHFIELIEFEAIIIKENCFCVENIKDFIGKGIARKEANQLNLISPKQTEKILKYKYRTLDFHHTYMVQNINSVLKDGERIVSLTRSAENSSHYVILIEHQELEISK